MGPRRASSRSWATARTTREARFPASSEVPGIIAFAGGLPIMGAGAHIGGIVVSGGTADEDEACAQAGLDAVKDMLK